MMRMVLLVWRWLLVQMVLLVRQWLQMHRYCLYDGGCRCGRRCRNG